MLKVFNNSSWKELDQRERKVTNLSSLLSSKLIPLNLVNQAKVLHIYGKTLITATCLQTLNLLSCSIRI